MIPFNLKVLAKLAFGLLARKNLDECSLARARKIFATTHILGFWSMVKLENIRESCTLYDSLSFAEALKNLFVKG